MAKIIGIIGSRSRDTDEDYESVYREFSKWYSPGDVICSGGCPKGGDRFAEIIAGKLGLNKENGGLIIHYPKIEMGTKLQKFVIACYKRNTLIARDSHILIACVAPNRMGGTEDTIRKWERINRDHSKLIIV